MRDYWRGKGVEWGELGHVLPSTTFLKLASIITSDSAEDEDKLGWFESNRETFSVKSAYGLEAH